jgi:hypothetical protein
MPTAQEVNERIEKADSFALDAVGQLALRDITQTVRREVMEELTLQLKTQFLFPNLGATQRFLLIAVYWQKQALTRLIHIPHQEIAPSLQSQVERVTCKMEQAFMGVVTATRVLLPLKMFSSLQLAILEREYFTVVMEDPE